MMLQNTAVHGPATRNDPGQVALSAEGERPGRGVALECLPEPSPILHTKPRRKKDKTRDGDKT